MSPAGLAWLHRAMVWVHLAGVVVWMGAVAYHLFILRPAMKAAGVERQVHYAIHRAVKRRLRVVVGSAVAAIVVSGFVNAWLRGLLGNGASGSRTAIFHAKLALAALLVLTFLFAFRVLDRVKTPRLRGRLYIAIHWPVLIVGSLGAAAGVMLSR